MFKCMVGVTCRIRGAEGVPSSQPIEAPIEWVVKSEWDSSAVIPIGRH